MIASMNHIMQEGLKMIFLPLRVFMSFKYLAYPNLGNNLLISILCYLWGYQIKFLGTSTGVEIKYISGIQDVSWLVYDKETLR